MAKQACRAKAGRTNSVDTKQNWASRPHGDVAAELQRLCNADDSVGRVVSSEELREVLTQVLDAPPNPDRLPEICHLPPPPERF